MPDAVIGTGVADVSAGFGAWMLEYRQLFPDAVSDEPVAVSYDSNVVVGNGGVVLDGVVGQYTVSFNGVDGRCAVWLSCRTIISNDSDV